MGIVTLGKVILSLIFVIVFMYLILKIMQKYIKLGTKNSDPLTNIKISNITYIDENTKIVHISRNETSYVLAINKNNIALIDKYETTSY